MAQKNINQCEFYPFCCGLAVPIIGQQIGFGGLFIAHFMIGFCIGVYLPMTISLALKSLNPSVWLIVMAAYSLRVSVGMDAGVGISGEFVEILNWRWIYWLSAIFTLVILFLPGGECHSHLLIKHCSLKVIGEEWRLNA